MLGDDVDADGDVGEMGELPLVLALGGGGGDASAGRT